jgi:HSP20 family protein
MFEQTLEGTDIAEEVRRLFRELAGVGAGCREIAAECTPPLDVFETADAFEVRIDLPGVARDSVRISIKGEMLIVAGEKWPNHTELGEAATFHQVERSFGRFARAIRLKGAIDAGKAAARLRHGQLAISVPKVADRRGRQFDVPIE